MRTVDSHLVYGFNENAENKGDLSQLTAKYKGEFWYTNRSVPNVVTTSSVDLQYENGSANGAIYSKQETDYKLFDIASTNNPRELEITPSSTWLDNSTEDLVPGKNSPHRALLNVHFINGKDGTENKSLVGKGGNDVFYGVIGAEKQ